MKFEQHIINKIDIEKLKYEQFIEHINNWEQTLKIIQNWNEKRKPKQLKLNICQDGNN